jgi:hypothetical protein
MRVAHIERESDKHGVGHLGSEFLIFPGFSSIPWLFGRVSVHLLHIFLVLVVWVACLAHHLSRVGLLTYRSPLMCLVY